ncbi:hypothetical protein Pint_03689 [Pistacia integerrima]|uniref:Uncharacterized protein n=1 Tax=Pistacia integerrima TaxID=434235 RepID=A0ACC0Z336_9ROSI|nr:hypothetical protein Pint_03689 [Pistacia integerrima]
MPKRKNLSYQLPPPPPPPPINFFVAGPEIQFHHHQASVRIHYYCLDNIVMRNQFYKRIQTMEGFNVMNEGERKIKHYSSAHQILLVGEGDFSFAACLAKAFGSAANMIATSLDSREMLTQKYSSANSNLIELEKRGCTIVHGVDANTMSHHPLLRGKSFDRIVFNFPHAGFFFREHDSLQIGMHQTLVRGFLSSARNMLKEKGEVHVTHKIADPFDRWELEKLAAEVGLSLVEKAWFYKSDYPGYENKRGSGQKFNKGFPVGLCMTFKFAKASENEQ